MTLADDIPEPPSLPGPQSRGEYEAIDVSDDEAVVDDYRREDIEGILRDGAWADAFTEWAESTSLSTAEFQPVVDHGLIDRYDFYWDPSTDEVGYIAPTIPAEASGAFDPAEIDEIEAELDALGRVVSEMLENDYLLRDEEAFGFFADDDGGDGDGAGEA